ncbi:MAG: hypothetical protein KF760_25445 [Candidatus Eremiobacteraeota bacterium]|nr:hypothetical protein [Candidatus Eremiobacteraeota bacterium]MCW5866822.1 hypothetical protein [Candidatus Eremiobacteraeota bacterium]
MKSRVRSLLWVALSCFVIKTTGYDALQAAHAGTDTVKYDWVGFSAGVFLFELKILDFLTGEQDSEEPKGFRPFGLLLVLLLMCPALFAKSKLETWIQALGYQRAPSAGSAHVFVKQAQP